MKTVAPEILEKRDKREEKRAKQRLENVKRAEKMHLARIKADIEAKPAPDFKSKIHIGCSGWFYWDWRGEFYPQEMPTSKWFDHYSQAFKTVELNAPFYSWPTLATVKTWLKQIGRRNFIYTVKVSELITHVKRFKATKTLVKDFGFIVDLLGKHMGCLLYQLPPSYTYTPARLKSIISQLEPGRRNVVEFRHISWWNEKVYEAFRKSGIIFCSCSGPRLPDKLVTTCDEVYVRFHGTKKWYLHDYSTEELMMWVEQIKEVNPKHIWVYFNNDHHCYSIKNAQQFLKLLEASL